MRRASDAARSRPQRRRPASPKREACASPTAIRSNSTARHAYRLERRRGAAPRAGRARRTVRGFPGGHRQRRAQGPRLRDHRRIGARDARPLCRRGRLFLARRIDGFVHRASDRAGEGRHDPRPGRRRHRRRQRSGLRTARVRGQGRRAARSRPRGRSRGRGMPGSGSKTNSSPFRGGSATDSSSSWLPFPAAPAPIAG